MAKSAAAPVAHELSKVLADSYNLYLKTHGYHWNVRGPMFNSLHNMFMTQYTELWNALDLIAERIRALGELAPMTGSSFGNLSNIGEGDATLDSDGMIKDLIASNEALVSTIKKALERADEDGDDPTVDLLTQRRNQHEKTLWMLKALLA